MSLEFSNDVFTISSVPTVNLNVLVTLLSCYTDLRVEREQKLAYGLL